MKTAHSMTFGGDYSRLYDFPSFVDLVYKNLLHIECTRYSCNIANLRTSMIDGHKNNLTMVSDA
jgi:hypothetical protein